MILICTLTIFRQKVTNHPLSPVNAENLPWQWLYYKGLRAGFENTHFTLWNINKKLLQSGLNKVYNLLYEHKTYRPPCPIWEHPNGT